ncbi:MAG: c-type cytochrome [Rickettsiales bacterium]
MKNLEGNKIVASVLLATLIALLCGKLAHFLYRPVLNPEPRGFSVAASDDGAPKEQAKEIPFETLLQNGSADAGKKIFAKCGACHNDAEGAGAKIGPNLYGVLNRDKGTEPGFAYSDGMKDKGGKWTYDDLHHFIKSPRDFVSGTKMSFAGLRKDEDIANVVLYLRSMGDVDVPLPEAPVAAPDEKAPKDEKASAESSKPTDAAAKKEGAEETKNEKSSEATSEKEKSDKTSPEDEKKQEKNAPPSPIKGKHEDDKKE